MVDSAVTLSIGTELDLSGFKRDLAALKNQKFDFNFDADKIGRSFRDASRQMQLTPKVDFTQLHELNKLLEIKLNHLKKVQKYFDANPLKVKVDSKSLGVLKGLESMRSAPIRVTGRLSESNKSLGELKEISKNTKSSFVRSLKAGAAESVGASFVQGTTLNKLATSLGTKSGEFFEKQLKKIKIDFETGAFLADVLEQVNEVLAETKDWGAALDVVKNKAIDLAKTKSQFKELESTVNAIKKEFEGQEVTLENVLKLSKKVAIETGKIAAVTAAQQAGKSVGSQLDRTLKKRREEGIKIGAALAQERAQDALTAKGRESVSKKMTPETEEFFITTGGYAGARGLSGLRIAADLRKQGKSAIGVKNVDTDIQKGLMGQAPTKLLALLTSLAKPNLRGYSKDAVDIASQALAAIEINPNVQIKIIGESGGGFAAEEAVQILRYLGVKNVSGIGVGTPNLIGGMNPQGFQKIISPDEMLGAETQKYAQFGFADVSAKEQNIPGVVEHPWENYVNTAEYLNFILGDLESLTADAAKEVMMAVEDIQKMSLDPLLSNKEIDSLRDTINKNIQQIRRNFYSTKDSKVRQQLEQAEQKSVQSLGFLSPDTESVSRFKGVAKQIAGLKGKTTDPKTAVQQFATIRKEIEVILSQIESEISSVDDVSRQKLQAIAEYIKKESSNFSEQKASEVQLTPFRAILENAQSIVPEKLASAVENFDFLSLVLDQIDQIKAQIDAVDVAPSLKSGLTKEFEQLSAEIAASIESSIDAIEAPPLNIPVKIEMPEPELVAMAPADIADVSAKAANISTEVATQSAAKKAKKATESLKELGDELDAAFKALGGIDESTLASFSTTMEEFKAFLMDSNNMVMSSKKKGQPDLRGVAKTLGVPTKNPATTKAFRKEELVDYLLGTFDLSAVQDAVAKVGAGLPSINQDVLPYLAEQYEKIGEAIAKIDKSPIEQQLKLWDELEAKLLNVAEGMNRLQREYSFPQEINQAFQGRKQAFEQQYFSVKKGQESAKTGVPRQMGRDIVAGIDQGIKDGQKAIESAAQEIGQTLIDKTKDELGIQSPSREFMKIGQFVVQGLNEGIEGEESSGLDGLTEAISSGIEEIKKKVAGKMATLFSSVVGDSNLDNIIQSTVSSAVSGFDSLFGIAKERLSSVFAALKESMSGALALVESFTANIKGNLIKVASLFAQAFVLTKIIQGLSALGSASFETALQVEQLTRSLSFSTADGGVATLEKIRKKANELNVSFIEAAQGYSQLAASTLGTQLEGQTENIFEGVATAIAARGLSNENQSRAFLAISQIASKGRVSLEELNGQLGEALPGALQTAARALGVTSQELIKMVETGQLTAEEFLPKFAAQLSLEAGSSVAAAAGSATAQLTKFDNQLTQIRANIGKGVLDALAKVLPIVNAGLAVISDNTETFTLIATSLATVLAFNLGHALLTVASQLKVVNLFMAVFGLNIAPATSLATGKATFAINGMNLSLAGTSAALKALAVQALPLLAIAAAFNAIRSAVTPLNEDVAKTSKGLKGIADRLEKQRKSQNTDSDKINAANGVYEEPTAARVAIASTSSGISGAQKQIALARDFAIKRAGGIENVSRLSLQTSVATEKFLSGLTFGLAKRSDTSFAVEEFLQFSKQAREAARAVEEVQAKFQPLSAEATARLQEIDDQSKKLRVQINVESGRGGDTSALQEQLNLLQDQRREILGSVQGYDDAVAVSQQLEDAIGNLNKQYEDNKISTTDYNRELGFLQGLQSQNQALLDQYAESTNTITTNVRELAAEIRSVSLELDKARGDAERTATAAQTALIKERLGGEISAADFGVQQSAITAAQTQAIAAATETAQTKAFNAIQQLDQAVVEQLEVAFGGAGFTGGLSQVLNEATTESLEQAKTAFQTAGGDIDPTGEAAINAIQQYIELRDQSLGLEKEIAELELDRRQQVADSLQEEIDLQNNRAQSAIEVASLQSQVSLTAKQAASELSSFDVELANFAEQARAARAEAGRLSASAQENRLAAQNQDLLPGDRERFIQTATREALEAQLKEQEAVLAETQARIATALRPVELGEQAAQIREQELQVTNAIRENLTASSKALSDFDRQIIGFGNSISQLIEEATNLESGAIAKRTAAENVALPPDERQRLLREATADDLLAQQKRSEAELQRVEAGRVTQLREVELATKAAQFANTEYYQSRRIAILAEQANAKTADEIATAAIISQKKQLDLEVEFTQRKINLNRQELAQQRDLYRQGVIDLDTFNERVISLEEERLQLQEQATDQRIQLNQREIDNLNTLKEQLRSLDQIRSSVVEAQLSSQQRLIQSSNVYGDALFQQAELIRVAADAQRQADEAAIAAAEADNTRLGKRRGVIDNLRSAFDIKETPQELKALQDQVQSLLRDLDFGRGFNLNLKDMGGEELFGLLQTLREAQSLGLTGDQLTLTNSLALEEEIQKRNLEIEQQRQAIQEQEKETQKQLLAIEIERNKVAAQTQIKEAEIAALRAKSAVTTAEIETRRASTPEEAIQAQLALLQAQEEFQFALSGVDLAKQNAVITDRLAQLQGGGMAIALDPDVQKIADIGKSMESIVDFSKYDQLLSQLEKAAAPLENEIGVQERAVNATNKLSTGIDLLNQKIERLVTTLGRPNIAVSGGSSVTEAIEIMRAVG